ncbi:hypothetical protein EC968_004995, partial [Mortierella alpina]
MWPIRIENQLAQLIKECANKHGVELNVVLLTAWMTVLSRLSGELELSIALQGFISDLGVDSLDAFEQPSIRADLTGDPSAERLLARAMRAVLNLTAPGLQHQKDPAARPQALFHWHSQGQGLNVEDMGRMSSGAIPVAFDVELHLQNADDKIAGALRFATAPSDPLTIERHAGYLQSVLEGMITDPKQPVGRINILSLAERTLLLDTWNTTPTIAQGFPTIHRLFEEQVLRTPGAVALVHEDQSLTYAELNAQSNSLAHRLIEMGVRPDACVAICVSRSIAMVIGILAILKAGGAYVPLDPTYPSERLRIILGDASPSIMVVDGVGRASIDEDVLCSLTLVDPNTPISQQTTNLQVPELTSRHLAYIIYTSGSTGKPKGVMVEHRGVVSLIQHQSDVCGIREHSRSLQLASISFDFSVLEIFLSITLGLTLHLAPEGCRVDRNKLWDYVIQHDITFVSCTPSFLHDGKDLPTTNSTALAIKPLTLLLGGEALGATLLQNLLRQGITVFNDYGPTEASVSSVVWRCPKDYEGDVVPIGRPVGNALIYVLDVHQQLVPIGTVGELYIGGVGVARGYLNRPEQDKERFLRDHFSSQEGARMYRTGDLVRYLPDGNLVYLGRTDDQVKIRGFRIELGEIEACLVAHEWVSEAVVLTVSSGNEQQLIAYVVSEPQDNLPRQLRSYLAAKLPQYMVPAAYIRLDAMPRTANDKLDRKALPAPDENSFAREAYEAPQGYIENKLAGIWTQLLQVHSVSRHDNFFALGGHSLLAAQILDHLRRVDLTVTLQSLFKCPTLSTLAQTVSVFDRVAIPPNLISPECDALAPEMLPLIDLNQSDIDRIINSVPGGLSNIQDIYSLSPLQEGILFHHLLATDGDPYLLTSTVAFDSRTLLDHYLAAFQTVVNRHDILRTAFFWESMSTTAQVVHRRASLPIEEIVLDPADGDIIEQLDSRFNPKYYRLDLRQAPLLRFIVAKDTNDRWILVQLRHHLLGDHEAEDEINTEIKALLDDQEMSLPKPRPFRDHLAHLYRKSSPEDDKEFFRGMLADVDEPTLPFGLTKVDNTAATVQESHRILPQDLNDRIRYQAKQLRVSLATICHVAWALVLAHASGRQQVVFGTVLSGRVEARDGYGHPLGLSMNTLPFRCDIDERCALDCIWDTHSRLTALLEHEHASLALALRCSSVPEGIPLFSGLLHYRHSTPPTASVHKTATTELSSQDRWFEYPGLQFLSSQESTNYPLVLSIDDYGTSLGLTSQVMKPFDPTRMSGYMQKALESLLHELEAMTGAPIQNLNILPAEERQMLLRDWNWTQEDCSEHFCLHHLFEQQVERTPEAIALVHEDQLMTYAELNIYANRLAHRLIELGIVPDGLVAICVERSPAMIIGILATLKAGGAYVPLDPAHASERLINILSDASPSVVLADSSSIALLQGADLPTLKTIDLTTVLEGLTTNPHVPNLSTHNLAYVIYTSGSTGTPKGVMVEHRQVTRLFKATATWFDFTERDTWCLFYTFAFDLSVWEIWGALLHGAKLVVVPYAVTRSPQEMYRLVCDQNVTVLNMTPTAFKPIMENHTRDSREENLRYVILGGEALVPAMLQSWYASHAEHSPRIVNMYGPTETTVNTTYRLMTSEDCDQPISPIGVRFPDARTYVLDGRGQPVPMGAVGELYVGGAGVARGYLNRPELTTEMFLPDSFSGQPDARMYRTGDLVRYLPDGSLLYLGRNDLQIKIRGFRIELGEIEMRLSEHPMVSEVAIVTLGDDINKRLVAYVIVRPDDQLEPSVSGAN